MKTTWVLAFLVSVAALADVPYDQSRLESRILDLSFPDDDFVNFPEPDDVPQRQRDATKGFRDFLQDGGWTTNQLINGLVAAYTNNIDGSVAGSDRCRRIAGMSLDLLGEINNPVAHDNLLNVLTNDTRIKGRVVGAIPGVFRYTNLDPEVMKSLRDVCVRTNIYEDAAAFVTFELMRCVEEMPLEYRASATTNVAKFIYFSIKHGTTRENIIQDSELAKFLPVYSNSCQRLEAMRHIVNTVTNERSRAFAQTRYGQLLSLPTNQLNNVSWLTEE